MAYQQPLRVICAREPEQVLAALADVEAETERGNTAVGYVAYEAAAAFDPAYACHRQDLPLVLFAVFDRGRAVELEDREGTGIELEAELSETEYARRLATVRKYLGAGDSYQVNLTFKLRGEVQPDYRSLFANLVRRQPGTRSVYLEWDGHAVCSLSPELFFQLDGERITMEPMKGTRPRGPDWNSDERLGRELLGSEKERAENLMIVDMVRNDLGRIALPGSVKVDELFRLVRLPTLWQQVSTVSCSTRATLAEIFQATFPCASITGAPKARTMEIIHELENGPRGIYTGAVGYAGPGHRARFNVAIRTLVIDRSSGQGELGVGGGVVWDSNASSEWQEALNKARFLQQSPPADFQLLETMLYEPDRGVFLLQSHLQRLARTAAYFGYPCAIDCVENLLGNYEAEDRQKLRLLLDARGGIQLEATTMAPDKDPVRLAVAAAAVQSRDPFLHFKTTRRNAYDEAKTAMAWCADSWDDLILWNERGELTETCIYNLFLEIDGELLTPVLNSGLLAGTYRQLMLERGEAREAVLNLEDLDRASRIFVSNSVRGLQQATLADQANSELTAFQA